MARTKARSCSTARMRCCTRWRAQGRLRVPALRAVPAHDGVREHRLRPAGAAAPPASQRSRRSASASRSCSTWCSSTGWPSAFRAQLSGGQRQRVALARALAVEPKCCCSTSRSARSTPRCARSCADGCAGCTTSFTSRDLRHARPGRSAESRRPRRGDEQGAHPAGRHAAAGLRSSATPSVHEFIGKSIVVPVVVDDGDVRFDGLRLVLTRRGFRAARHGCSRARMI